MILQSVSHVADHPRADASGEDPGAGGHGGLDEPLPKHLLQLGLQVKVLQSPVDGDQELGQLQLPVLHHEMEQCVWLGVVGHTDVHGLVCVASPLELEVSVGVRGEPLGVFCDGPFLGLRIHWLGFFFCLIRGPAWRNRDVLGEEIATATPVGIFAVGNDVDALSFGKGLLYPCLLTLRIAGQL